MASLDMSLEDMIKNRRNSNRGRGQGRPHRGRGAGGSSRGGRTFGAPRRNPLGVNARPSAYTIAKSIRRNRNLPWQNGLFEDSLKAVGLPGLETGTKLYVSNLDIGVTNEDIRDLFSEIGELIRYAIHFDKNGRPNGSAEVVFARTSDAYQALKKYNNVQLDGRPMKIVIIGANTNQTPGSANMKVVGATNGKKRTVLMSSGRGRFRGGFVAANRGSGQRGRGGSINGGGRGRGGRGGGRGRGRGRGGAPQRKRNVEKSADELDKELENYHAEAMQS